MNELAQLIRELPGASVGPLIVITAAGVLLWGAGRKVLRIVIAAGGLGVGGAIGWIAGETVNLGVPQWVSAIAGGALLACVAAMAYRITLAGLMAALLGLAAPVMVIAASELLEGPAVMHAEPGQENARAEAATEQATEPGRQGAMNPESSAQQPSTGESLEAEMLYRAPLSPQHAEEAVAEDSAEVDPKLRELREFVSRLGDALRQTWEATPESLRPRILIAAVVGGAIGLLLGVFAGKFSAAVVTSIGGSLLWLTGLRILAMRIGVPEGPWLPASGSALAGMWMAASAVGLAIQWIFRGGEASAADK